MSSLNRPLTIKGEPGRDIGPYIERPWACAGSYLPRHVPEVICLGCAGSHLPRHVPEVICLGCAGSHLEVA